MEQSIIPAKQNRDLELTATIPQEMVESQTQLIEWCNIKVASIQADVKELEQAVDHAVKSKWSASALRNQLAKAKKTLIYYVKVREALNEGYYIVPNFPVQLFAIRTKKEEPQGYSTYWWATHEQDSQQLQQGEGEYRNPFPVIQRTKSKDEQGRESVESYPVAWGDVEFPITMAKPVIMQATSRAMALQIFDEIGVFPPTKKEDPVIIGRIKLKHGGISKTVSFMIAWHLNTNQI